jgi:predicted kinase
MQKWTRDRGRRRPKSKPKTEQSTPAQAPLQPAYFDAEASPKTPVSEIPTEAAEPNDVDQDAAFQPGNVADPDEPSSQPAAVGEGQQRRPRRRRSRGGRGRTSQTQRSGATRQGAGAKGQTAPETPAAEEAVPVVAETIASANPAASDVASPAPPMPSSKGVVVLAIGLPGSGKSSWFKRHSIRPLSSDLLRELLFDNADEQRFQDLIFSNLRSMLKARLIARRPTNYVDATNLTPHDRQSWIKLAKDYRYDVQAVYFDVPVEVCLERNQRRQRVVPEDVMRRFASKLRAPTFEEGFSKITVVRVKKKD